MELLTVSYIFYLVVPRLHIWLNIPYIKKNGVCFSLSLQKRFFRDDSDNKSFKSKPRKKFGFIISNAKAF